MSMEIGDLNPFILEIIEMRTATAIRVVSKRPAVSVLRSYTTGTPRPGGIPRRCSAARSFSSKLLVSIIFIWKVLWSILLPFTTAPSCKTIVTISTSGRTTTSETSPTASIWCRNSFHETYLNKEQELRRIKNWVKKLKDYMFCTSQLLVGYH